MPNSNAPSPSQIVSEVIQKRQTIKVLHDGPRSRLASDSNNDAIVFEAIATAGWAPFHYDRSLDGMAEPWRVDFLGAEKCRLVASNFFDWFDDVKPSNKLPAMLNACGCLVLVSWLPQFSDASVSGTDVLPEKQRQVDEEHLAATAAYVQNLILVLTAHNFGTYWSSGGQFRLPSMREKLGLSHEGRLLGAIFVDYNPNDDATEKLNGKLRTRRDTDRRWFNVVK